MKEFESTMTIIFGTATTLVVIILIYKAFVYFKNYNQLVPLKSTKALFAVNKIAWTLAMVAFINGLFLYALVLMRGSALAPQWLREAFQVSLMALMVWYLLTIWKVVEKGKKSVVFLSLLLSIILLLSGLLLRREYVRASQFPPVSECAVMELPFNGEWVAIGAGATGRTNHHDRIPSQKYAIDFARVGENGKLFTGEGKTNRESNTWGATILSPVYGEVVWAVDSLEDDNSREQLAGNHVIIGFDDTLYVALAHFMQGSLRVKPGDMVFPGDTIALAGNSGNSDFPHLHIHVQTTPEYDLHETQTVPFRFARAEVNRDIRWRQQKNLVLLSNDRVRTIISANNSQNGLPQE